MGLADLDLWVDQAGMTFVEAPISDYSAPDSGFLAAWPDLKDDLFRRLEAGEKVFLHCRAGLGRSGTITAALLISGGMDPDNAIHAVRAVRPGAIETSGQVEWLRSLIP
jgi:ADP-ribosyl-[dinitrogen reductase] hydrolase